MMCCFINDGWSAVGINGDSEKISKPWGTFEVRSGVISGRLVVAPGPFGGRWGLFGVVPGSFGVRSGLVRRSFGSRSGFVRKIFDFFSEKIFEKI